MEMALDLNPSCLPPGTQVGPWRVVELRGRGTYGAVYRAEGEAASVALKLARYPRDERFAREVELLSRVQHPSIPRLRDHGHWRHPEGTLHPYVVMDYVEGLPLYEWAQEEGPTSRQVMQLLARLARALQAIHEAQGVHRDVKGSNVVVRCSDGQVFLTDFGSGRYTGAATLTWQPLPPGTPAYRSPEAWRFALEAGRVPTAHYVAKPADDVFALGVTAYRMVTEAYPPSTDPADEESRVWRLEGAGPRPPRALNARCSPELSAIVSRMLSVRPEARGSARELAEELEQAARYADSKADVPLLVPQAPRPVGAEVAPHLAPRAQGSTCWQSCLASAVLGGLLMLGVAGAWRVQSQPEAEAARPWVAQQGVDANDGGTVAVGDTALAAPMGSIQDHPRWLTLAVELPRKPFPGQTRPDAKGRCPLLRHTLINGGCWVKVDVSQKICKVEAYEYNGACYLPAFPPAPAPVSSSSAPARRGE